VSGDACNGLDDLEISGTDAPEVNDSYAATGGLPPYTWSISQGSIDASGRITSLSGACGPGTVTVADACGNTAHLTVRFPSGVFTLYEVHENDCYWWTHNSVRSVTEYEGKYKYIIQFYDMTVGTCDNCETIRGWGCSEDTDIYAYFDLEGGPGDEKTIYPGIIHTYEWVCP
jgi:hypothetical protein